MNDEKISNDIVGILKNSNNNQDLTNNLVNAFGDEQHIVNLKNFIFLLRG